MGHPAPVHSPILSRKDATPMRKTVLTFGSISGAILSIMMLATMPFIDRIGFDKGEVIGYTTMVVAFLLIFFGIRSYRDNVAGGSVGFGRAFAVGALIALVASVFYVATWQVVYYKLVPDFGEKYQAHMIEKARADGESQAAIDEKIADAEKYARWFRNPAMNVAVSFIEPLPVGLIIALISAGILRRRVGPTTVR
jgi:Protein of unknown function (DUF4199)